MSTNRIEKDALADKFTDLPLEIKVVPSGIVGAVAYRLLVKQVDG